MGIHQPSGKTIVIILIYMMLVYTTVHVFTNATADNFVVGGSRSDLLETEEFGDDPFQAALFWLFNDNLSHSEKWDHMNETFGPYRGKKYVFNWFDTGWYHCWGDEWKDFSLFGNDGYMMKEDIFEKYLDGTLTASDISFQDNAGRILGTIWDAMGYVTGLLTFNIAGSTLSDGSTVPVTLSFVPFLMVLVPWVLITYWILPYAIEIVKAIGGLIPFT